MAKTSEVRTKTNFIGTPVKDAAGEFVKEITTTDSETNEKETFTEETKTNFIGTPVRDEAGELVKEIKKED